MSKQLPLPHVRQKPNTSDIKDYVKSRLEGLELRQAERARKRARKTGEIERPALEQQPLFSAE